MTEHRIRLRGGWWEEVEGAPPRRLTLPTRWDEPHRATVRLTRTFQRPPINPANEALWLVIADAPGLRRVELNGRALEGPGPQPWDFPAGSLEPTGNRLVLELEPAAAAGFDAWGDVALVIRPGPEGVGD